MTPPEMIQLLTALLLAAGGWILKVHWAEIVKTRKDSHFYANVLTNHSLRLHLLDGEESPKREGV